MEISRKTFIDHFTNKKNEGQGRKNDRKHEKKNAENEIENIKKSPFLINNGDVIGYRLEIENINDDDF